MFFSPHSISLALAMASVGARGETAAQMASALHFTLPPERLHPAYDALDLALSSRGASAPLGTHPFTLSVVNSMWAAPDMALAPSFLDTLATSYGAGVRLTDFGADPASALLAINGWVSDETHTRIPTLLSKDDITRDTRLVLVNAVYFKAGWAAPFPKYATAPAPFHASAGDTTVEMMHAAGGFAYAEAPGWKAVALPYEGNELSLVAVLPDDLATFEASLTGDPFRAIAPVRLPASTEVQVSLPRFTIDGASFSLRDALEARGMVLAFDPFFADFSGMAPAENVFISSVVHQAFVAVDEDGTEAAAATAVVLSDSGSATAPPEKVIDVTFDRPFVFFIRDNATGAILFLGRVARP
jgi:serpin B